MKRRAVALGVLVLAALGTGTARADDAVVPTATEAWYATLPPLAPRPAGTLHVGATAGLEDARTYLSLDLGALPADAHLDAGVLTLPIDAADSQAPETATIDVCSSSNPGESVEGSTDAAPPADCSVHAPAVLHGDAFTVDLGAFLPTLRTTGLALVPIVDGTATWHVAFWSRASESPDAVPITASLTIADEAVAAGSPASPRSVAPPEDLVVAAPLFASPGAGFAEPLAPTLPPTPVADDPAPASSLGVPTLPLAASPKRYADSLVFTLPLLLLGLVWYFGAALTRPIVVPEPESVSPPAGLRVPRRAPRPARAAREQRASG